MSSRSTPERPVGGAVTVLAARWGLALVLVATATAKLWPTNGEALLGPVLARVAAVVEVVIAIGLVCRRDAAWPAVAAITMALVGATVALLSRIPCGCAGPVELSGSTHFLLCMTTGFLASIAASSRLRR